MKRSTTVWGWLGQLAVLAWFAAVPAFAQSTTGGGNTYQAWAKSVTGDIYSQPKIIQDVDGDGLRDIIFGATDGRIHIFSAKGHEIFRPPNWPKQVDTPILAEINVADIDRDGEPEILACSSKGTVYCIAWNGREKWVANTRGSIRLSSPEVADLDGSGNMNVFVGNRAGKVMRFDKGGNLIWEIGMSTSVSCRVVLADLDGDGIKEIVAKDDNGKVTVLKQSGTPFNGWPQATVPNMTWPFEAGVTDIDGDGLREVYTTTPEKKFLIWSLGGELRREFGLTDGAHTAPRMADLNGDGKDEFIIGQADGTVMVCDDQGKPLKGWPYVTKHSIYYSPQIIDLDGDGKLDVVYTAWNPEGVGKQAGYIMALSGDGRVLSGYPKFIGKSVAPLTFADLNGDGFLEMIAAGGVAYTGEQLNVFPTEARVQIKMAVLGAEVSF